jgi:hypothetical protein
MHSVQKIFNFYNNLPHEAKARILVFLLVFVVSLIFLELVAASFQQHGDDYWSQREITENTALEMHAEDIWLHGQSTLATFNPQACKSGSKYVWPYEWIEVVCFSRDSQGVWWAYTANYGVRSHYLSLLIPDALLDPPPARVMRQLGANNPALAGGV